MTFVRALTRVLVVPVAVTVACGSENTNQNPNTGVGGAPTSGGDLGAARSGMSNASGPSSGGVSAGGATTGGATTGGATTGGVLLSGSSKSGDSATGGGSAAGGGGGPPATGGGTGGGGAGPLGGSAGMPTAGADGGPGKGAARSAGCGKSSGTPMNVAVANAIVTFPQGYDGSTPVPMLFGFHGANRTNQEFYEIDARAKGSDLEKHFLMVYLKSEGSGWVASDKARLDAAYDQMLQTYCIDTERVFATGSSSGAHFIEILLCQGERRFAGVALQSGYKECASWASTPALLIHGTNDSQRVSAGDANGRLELEPFVASNGCSMPTTPYREAQACTSIYDQAAVNNGCVAYTGCAAPLVFCNHDDLNYSGTNHGWPCFANQTIDAFFSAL